MATNEAWLALGREEALLPELAICDPHHHFWRTRQGGVEPQYLLDELLADIRLGHNIVSTVFIECGAEFRTDGPRAHAPLGETEFVVEIAEAADRDPAISTRVAAAIVGTVFLTEGDSAGAVLDAQTELARGRFRGIRQAASWDSSPEVGNHRTEPGSGLYLDTTFRRGFAHLGPRGLTYEGWCYHPQIVELADLARAFPDTTIILDHFGGPIGIGPYAGRRDEVYAAWRSAIADLAQCPNVMAKLGGLAMEVNGYAWHENDRPPSSQALMEATRPYYEETIALFGPERCMFESNFPVDKLSAGYDVVWNSFKRLVADYSADEKAALFHDTAARVYRI